MDKDIGHIYVGEDTAENGPREPMPADRAGNSSLRMAFASVFFAWLGIWLTNFAGELAFYLGALLWLGAWLAAVWLAISALRNAYTSDQPRLVRRRAVVALIVTAVNLVLVCAFIFAVVQALEGSA